jgi:hypothetical protein
MVLTRKAINDLKGNTTLNTDGVFTLRINGYGEVTGIMDEERDVFYKLDIEGIRHFLGMLNIRMEKTSEFIQSIELQFKMFQDKEIQYHERIAELESKLVDLEDELAELKENRVKI